MHLASSALFKYMCAYRSIRYSQSSTQNAYYRYPASTACSFSQIAWCAFGEEKVSFAWNKVKKRTFTVDIITTGIVVDFPVSKMRQNWQAKAYFDWFLFRWMKRTISSMKTNYYRINPQEPHSVLKINTKQPFHDPLEVGDNINTRSDSRKKPSQFCVVSCVTVFVHTFCFQNED